MILKTKKAILIKIIKEGGCSDMCCEAADDQLINCPFSINETIYNGRLRCEPCGVFFSVSYAEDANKYITAEAIKLFKKNYNYKELFEELL